LAAAKLRRRSRKVFRVFREAPGHGWLNLHVARKERTDKLKSEWRCPPILLVVVVVLVVVRFSVVIGVILRGCSTRSLSSFGAHYLDQIENDNDDDDEDDLGDLASHPCRR